MFVYLVKFWLIISLLQFSTILGYAGELTRPRFDIEQYLNIRSAHGATFSPGSDQIAFLSNRSGVDQVWCIPNGAGAARQITSFPDRITFVKWSPNAEWLVFGMDDGGNEHNQIYLLSVKGAKVTALTHDPKVIHRFGGWSHDGQWIAYSSNQRNKAFFDVYIKNVQTNETRLLYQNDGENRAISWSPNDKLLLIEKNNSSMDQDLFALDLETKKHKHLTSHMKTAQYDKSVWASSSDGIYVLTNQDRDFRNLAYIQLAPPKLTYLEDTRWDSDLLAHSRDGRMLVWGKNVDGYSELKLKDIGKNREITPPKLPKGVISELELSSDGNQLLLTFSGSLHEADVWLYNITANKLKQVTQSPLAGIPRSHFIEPQLIHYSTFDDLKIPAFLYLPSGAQKNQSLPVIISIHGGPESQARPSFSPIFQFFVSRGFVVLVPNIRGSIGYGKRYSELDNARLRADAVKDVAYAAEYVKKSGYADPKKIVVMGGSYGGYMTLTSLTKLPDLWAAGVDLYGISNFYSFYKNTGPWRVKMRISEYGDPEKDKDFLQEYSPINHVDKIKAPLIVIQGANDPRVPKSESDQIVEQIRKHHGSVEYLVFDDEGHGLSKLSNRIRAYRAITNFLQRHLGLNTS